MTLTFSGKVVTACQIFCGYILNDFVFVIPYAMKYRLVDDQLFIAHHVCLLYTWASFMTGDPPSLMNSETAAFSLFFRILGSWGHLFAVPTMLTELTAPFVFLRWLLTEFKMNAGSFFIINGLLLMFAWCVPHYFVTRNPSSTFQLEAPNGHGLNHTQR